MKILVIDDNPAIRTSLKLLLSKRFSQVAAVGDPKLIPALLKDNNTDAVLLDMNFDNMQLDGSEGIFWLSYIKERACPPAVVLITAFGNVDLAVNSMKLGADDFIVKPWDNDTLVEKINNAISKNRKRLSEIESVNSAREITEKETLKNNMTLDEIKIDHIRRIIDLCDGNLSAASARLGINRQTLYNILKRSELL